MAWLPNIFKKSDRLVPHPNLPETLPPIGYQAESVKKSVIGKQLRAALGGAFSGSQVTNHREEALHFENFSYIAIHAIGLQVASSTTSAYVDGAKQQVNQSRRKSLREMYGSKWKSIYGSEEIEKQQLELDHELMKVLQRPNPHEPGSSFRYRQAIQIRLCGGAYVWNVPNAFGRTCERYVIPVVSMTPVFPTAELPYGGYRVQPNCMRWIPLDDQGYISGIPALARVLGMVIDAREVQKVGFPHPIYLDDFQSPMSAGSQYVDGERAISQARTSGISRGLDPSILITLPDMYQDVDQDTLDRATKAYEQKYGGPQQVGKPMVAAPGTQVTTLGGTPKDMGYHEGYEDHKAAVLALHNTPPVAVGLQEPGAYAAYYASMKSWIHTAIKPLCDMIGESDTFHLAPQFGEGITVEIDPPEINDQSETRANVQVAISAKSITKNTVNAALGFEPLEDEEEGNKLAGADEPQPAAGGMPGQQKPTATPKADDDTEGSDTSAAPPEDPNVEKPEFPEAPDVESPFRHDDTGKKPDSQSKALRAAIQAAHEGDEEYLSGKLGSLVDRVVESRLKSMTPDEIHRAAQEAEEPTDGQKDAGNYRKGHITIHGMRISIENPKGSIRSGKDSNGRKWSVEMQSHYGYIKGTQSGADGDHIDVFVGPNPDSELVFVVDQVKPDGKFDEHKAMLGYNSKAEAKQGYLDNYSSGWKGLGDITPMHIDQFKEWLNEGDSSEPIAEPRKEFHATNPRYITREELMNYKSLGMSTSIGADGGFAVPTEQADGIQQRQQPFSIGTCPHCGQPVFDRDEANGNDTCRAGHCFPMAMTVVAAKPVEEKPAESVVKSLRADTEPESLPIEQESIVDEHTKSE